MTLTLKFNVEKGEQSQKIARSQLAIRKIKVDVGNCRTLALNNGAFRFGFAAWQN